MADEKRASTEQWVFQNFERFIKNGSNPSTTKNCITKLWLIYNYNINISKLDTLSDKDLVRRELIQGEEIIFEEFDFCVIRYKWSADAGRDLDTATYFSNNNESLIDDKRIGWSFLSSLPIDGVKKYIDWVNDNTQSGVEAVLLNFKDLTLDFPNLPNTIKCYLRSAWYGEQKTGFTELEFITYKGGEMVKDSVNYNFLNIGGSVVQTQSISRYVDTKRQSYPGVEMTLMGIVNYDKLTKKANLIQLNERVEL